MKITTILFAVWPFLLYASAVANANSPAKANVLRLDYVATAQGCPSGEHLADEVSSKLGFVPWSYQAIDTLRVRISADQSEVVATMELPSGQSKVLRSSSCDGVFPLLAAAIAVALDSEMSAKHLEQPKATVPPPPPAQTNAPGTGRIHVRSTGTSVTVSTIDHRVFIAGSNGGTAMGVSWTERCTAPCSFDVQPGTTEVMIGGDVPAAVRKLNLSADSDTYLVAKPGSLGMLRGGYLISALGLGALTTGALWYFLPNEDFDEEGTLVDQGTRSWVVPAMIGGAIGTGIGIGMMYGSRSSLEEEEAAPQTPVRVHKAITYSGRF
jgi:hypothetical protein